MDSGGERQIVSVELVVIAAAILGCFGRAMLPYLRKLKEQEEAGEDVQFDFGKKYLFTTIFSLVVALIVGLMLFPQIMPNLPANGSLAGVFIIAFIFAWGSGDLFNEVVATGTAKPKPEPQPTPNPTPAPIA